MVTSITSCLTLCTCTVVFCYCDTAGIRKKCHIIQTQNIQSEFLMLFSSWDIDLVS